MIRWGQLHEPYDSVAPSSAQVEQFALAWGDPSASHVFPFQQPFRFGALQCCCLHHKQLMSTTKLLFYPPSVNLEHLGLASLILFLEHLCFIQQKNGWIFQKRSSYCNFCSADEFMSICCFGCLLYLYF